MDIMLNAEESRILGCLIEKKIATPDYYPLTLNALVNACNQKVSRDPVVSYSEDIILRAIKELKDTSLVIQISAARVPKYEERFTEELSLGEDEAGIICVLLLRGAQTVGEIKTRTDRLCEFDSLEEVNDVLEDLLEMKYIMRLPRQPGQKEVRYMHLFSGRPEIQAAADNQTETRAEIRVKQRAAKPVSTASVVEKKRLDIVEDRIAMLSAELHKLRQEFAEFRKQLE